MTEDKPTALVWWFASDGAPQANGFESQQSARALVVAFAGLGVAELVVVDLGGQLLQQGSRDPVAVPSRRDLAGHGSVHLRHCPLRVFPPAAAMLLASGTGS